MGISISEFSKLSKELTNSLKDISQQIDYLQDQMDSLAAVVQNRHGLDLLIAAQGGLCALLEEYCCFLTNKSDWYEMEHDNSGNRQTAAPPPHFLVIMGLTFLPCLISLFQRFQQEPLQCYNKGTIQDPTANISYLPEPQLHPESAGSN
jgi:hypothetical protein